MSTTAANAAIGPLAGRYLAAPRGDIAHGRDARIPLLMMTNAGGVLPVAAIGDRPVFTTILRTGRRRRRLRRHGSKVWGWTTS